VRLDPTAVSGRYQRARLEKLQKEIGAILRKADSAQYALAKRELAKIGTYEGGRAVALLGTEGVKAPIAPALMRALLETEPIHGRILRDWFHDLSDTTAKKVAQQVRIGVAEHETIDQITRRIRGRSIGRGRYAGGVMETTTRQATAIARTAVNDISNRAARNVYQANADLTKRYRYVATLDSRTTDICIALDGQEFEYDSDDARYPPQHVNCRSTIVPILLDPIGKPGKRASGKIVDEKGKVLSEGGPVPANTNYEQWLRSKTAEEQDAILGPSRGRLFRDDKITLRDLVRSDGTSKTVEELT
jgi:SPP1 gp7 family putative phage head morphogenesis protein